MQVIPVCVLWILAASTNEDLNINILESKLIEEVGNLESYLKQQDERIKVLETTVYKQQRYIQQLETKLKEEDRRITSKLGKAQDNKLSRGLRAATTPTHVAFSAYLDHKVSHLGIDEIIRFDKVILNDGGGYNSMTGVFTCPVLGVYLFTFMVSNLADANQLIVKLVLDGVNQSDGLSDPFRNHQEIQGGNTVIMKVKQGQRVWLAADTTGDTVVGGREKYRFTTLSGFLLYEK